MKKVMMVLVVMFAMVSSSFGQWIGGDWDKTANSLQIYSIHVTIGNIGFKDTKGALYEVIAPTLELQQRFLATLLSVKARDGYLNVYKSGVNNSNGVIFINDIVVF